MRAPIAKIRISAGNPGWYDPLTNIHLTITRPDAFVYEGQNVTNIKTAVSFKLVHVIEGELEPIKESPIITTDKVEEEVGEVITEVEETEDKEESQIPAEEEVKEEIIEEEIIEEESVEKVEEIEKEEVVEEVVEKKAAKKTTAKKTAKKKAE